MKTRCPKCKSFRSPGKPCKRCGDLAPELVVCNKAEECPIECMPRNPHRRVIGCVEHFCERFGQVAKCVPVPTPENTFGPGTILPDSPDECAECASLRQTIGEMDGEIAELEQANTSLRQQLADARAEIERLTKYAEDAVAERESAECAGLRKELADIRAGQEALRKDLERVMGERDNAREERDKMKIEKAELLVENADISAELARERAIVDALSRGKEA